MSASFIQAVAYNKSVGGALSPGAQTPGGLVASGVGAQTLKVLGASGIGETTCLPRMYKQFSQ